MVIQLLESTLRSAGEESYRDLRVPITLNNLAGMLLDVLSDKEAFDPTDPPAHFPYADPGFEERVEALGARLRARFNGN